jgi:hypothetical protein
VTRRPFNFAAGICLILFVVVVITWVCSFASETILVESRQGQLLLIGIDHVPGKVVREARDAASLGLFLSDLTSPPLTINGSPVPRPTKQEFLGFTLIKGQQGNVPVPGAGNGGSWTPPFWVVGIPYWALAGMTALVPLRWLWVRARHGRRRRRNLCTTCGYDLRAASGRCPECGAPAAAVE